MHNEKKILLIDDDIEFVMGVKKNLQIEGFEVVEAYDGIGGLKLAYQHHPDLIILDAMMPNLDGFKVCAKLKESPETNTIKVIMFTGAISTPEDEEKGRALADAFVIKGSRFTELLDTISKIFQLPREVD